MRKKFDDVIKYENATKEDLLHVQNDLKSDLSLLSFSSTHFDENNISTITVNEGKVKELQFTECTGVFSFKNLKIDQLNIDRFGGFFDFSFNNNTHIGELELNRLKDSQLGFTKIKIDRLIIINPIEDFKLMLDNLAVKYLYLNINSSIKLQARGLNKLEDLIIRNNSIEPEDKFEIENVNIENSFNRDSQKCTMTFINIDIKSLKLAICDFRNTVLNLDYFSRIVLIEYWEIEKWFKNIIGTNDKETINFYRMLKSTARIKNDITNEFFFRSKEFESIRKTLKVGFKPWKRLFWEKLLLQLNFISNNHGIDWQRAGLTSLVFTFIMFPLYVLCSGYLCDNSFPFEKVFVFYLPTHKPDFILDETGFLANLIDFLYRIGNSYLIYQFVAAFRRYNK